MDDGTLSKHVMYWWVTHIQRIRPRRDRELK